MKYAFTIAVILFWCAVGFIMFFGYTSQKSVVLIPAAVQTNTAGETITTATVAMHSIEKDCWVIVNDKAYNVTPFIPAHPGGGSALIAYCGKDATVAFNTNSSSTRTHSSTARTILANYLVGDVK